MRTGASHTSAILWLLGNPSLVVSAPSVHATVGRLQPDLMRPTSPACRLGGMSPGGGGGEYGRYGRGGGGLLLPWCVTGLYRRSRTRTKGIVPPSTKHAKKNRRRPYHHYLSKLGGGGGLGGVAHKDRARPPPPCGARTPMRFWARPHPAMRWSRDGPGRWALKAFCVPVCRTQGTGEEAGGRGKPLKTPPFPDPLRITAFAEPSGCASWPTQGTSIVCTTTAPQGRRSACSNPQICGLLPHSAPVTSLPPAAASPNI